MLAAAIDIGSNTIRMLIGDVQDNGVSRIYSDRVITRLAEGIGDSGILREENMKKSLSVLKGFSRFLASYGVTHVNAVGTSALREAKNSREFIDAAFQETGILIEIISGMKEAQLTAKGILLGLRETSEPSLIIDIGGGSTEWIIHKADPHELLYGSLPIGVVNLFERFIKTDPLSLNDISALNNEINPLLWSLKREITEYPVKNQGVRENKIPPTHFTNLIGTGGTITTLASIDLGLKEYDHERIHMHKISIERLYQIKDVLLSLPLSERQDINGLEQERADLIIPGIVLTIRVIEFFGFNEITVSDYGLLEGLLKERENENRF